MTQSETKRILNWIVRHSTKFGTNGCYLNMTDFSKFLTANQTTWNERAFWKMCKELEKRAWQHMATLEKAGKRVFVDYV